MAIQIQGNGGTIAEVDGTTFRALRVTARPLDYGALGYYSVAANTGTYAGLAAAAPLFSMRWGDATRFCVVYQFRWSVTTTVAFTAAQTIDRELIFARAFTVSDTGGTAVTLTGDNQAKRTSMGASLMTDMRVFSSAITAGTRTLDAASLGHVVGWAPASTGTNGGLGMHIDAQDFFGALAGSYEHPVVLAQNEGLIGRVGAVAMGAGGTQKSHIQVAWAEVAAF
jgi:hypothetical protein